MAWLVFSLLLALQAVLTLSSEAERTRPFASPMGQLMLTQRTSQAATKQVSHISSYRLSLAVAAYPKKWTSHHPLSKLQWKPSLFIKVYGQTHNIMESCGSGMCLRPAAAFGDKQQALKQTVMQS